MKNRLFYGDNLEVLKQNIANDSVDLIYLDPPFNSDEVYNVGFASAGDAAAQIQAFDDTWRWSNETSENFDFLVNQGGLPDLPSEALSAVRALLKESPMAAYMVAMTPRLVEMHRVLKSTGSQYLHCDPTASHYLKITLDSIFGPNCFRSEIIWRRTGAHGKATRFAPTHDVILFYTKSSSKSGYKWNGVRLPYMRGHVEQYLVQGEDGRYRTDYYGNVLTGSGIRGGESGMPWRGFNPTVKNRHWAVPGSVVEDSGIDVTDMAQHQKLDALFEAGYITITEGDTWPIYNNWVDPAHGVGAPDIWAYQPYTDGSVFGTDKGIDHDVRWLGTRDKERLGYPTQKPVGLLKRIIEASTDPGDVVLDPFCGCGTAMDAAIRTDRNWIGIDITFIAVDLIRNRLRLAHGDSIDATYEVLGVPADLAAAHALMGRDDFEFERWAVSLVRGTPKDKRGKDRGRDGLIRFFKGRKEMPGRVVVSVKGGKQLNPGMVRDLAGVVASDPKLDAGVFITLWNPTKGMREAAETSGTWTDVVGNSYPLVQIATIEDLLHGKKPMIPLVIPPYQDAKPVKEQFVEEMLFDL